MPPSHDVSHEPVLVRELLEALAPFDGGIYVDGTFGGGGHSRALLEAADCRVFAIDRDPQAVAASAALQEDFSGRLRVVEGRFADMGSLLACWGIEAVDGVFLDVGFSAHQVECAQRGFSFLREGPLDMRMESRGKTAASYVNNLSETMLARVFSVYGEERRARAIARAIVKARGGGAISQTSQLVRVIASVVPRSYGRHPAMRTFQALRILVNDELRQLARGLCAAERVLKAEGRLAIVAFHSLEDRIVKRFLLMRPRSFRLLFRGVRRASDAEIQRNRRARSARLRGATRLAGSPYRCDERALLEGALL